MRNFIDSLKESILIVDNDGKISLSNKNFLENIKYSHDEILNYNIVDILYNENDFNMKKSIGKNIDIIFKDKNGTSLEFNGNIACDTLNNETMVFISGFFKEEEYYNRNIDSNETAEFYELIIGLKNDIMNNLGADNVGSLLYSEREEKLINELCNQITVLIKNKRLSKDLEYEFKKRTELERQMQNYLDISADLIAIFNKDGEFIKVNQVWTDKLGWTKEEFLSANWQDFVYEEDIDLSKEYEKLLLKNKEIKGFVNRYMDKWGNIKWLEWGARYIEDKGIFLTTARDITEERKIKKDTKLYKEALELESIKNEFFANISHEFKTPLNIILSSMQLINSNVQNGNLKGFNGFNINKYMNFIKQNSYRLLRLVNNLIDMTKIETGYYHPEFENHNIVEIIEEITVSVADYIEGKNVELVFDTNEEEKIVACDPDKLERVMLNLLSNAVKYSKKDGKILVNMNIEMDWITVSVQNDGLPIPKEKLEEIFERFTQIENEITKVAKGSGIGLSLCKSLIEMQGGSIWAESGDDEMTRFIFTLPVRRIKEDEINKIKISTNNLQGDNVEKCSIEFSDIYQ